MATIRGLDPELYKLARAEAIKEGKTFGKWMNEAIKEKLEKKGVGKCHAALDSKKS